MHTIELKNEGKTMGVYAYNPEKLIYFDIESDSLFSDELASIYITLEQARNLIDFLQKEIEMVSI